MEILKFISGNELLKTIIKEHLSNNKALNAPYHNFYHHLVVANSCLEACNYSSIYGKDKLEVIVAALWHDFNHSMGEKKDDWNVQEAISKCTEWYMKEEVEEVNINRIIAIIKATQFPYTIPAEDLTKQQAIIRDADLTQLIQPNRIQQVYIGLATEMKLPLINVLKGEKAFLNSIEPCTEWFKPILSKIKKDVIAECDSLIDMMHHDNHTSVELNVDITENDQKFINELCSTYDFVCRGGENSKHWTSEKSTINDIVVYEAGVRGPAEFYYKQDDVWHHGNYTAYKETYTNISFIEMLIKVEKHNKEFAEAVEKDEKNK